MGVLVANLKLFYQNKGVCFFGGLLVLFWGLPICQVPEQDELVFVLMAYALIVGIFVSAVQKEMACRPMCFSLLGRVTALRRVVFVVGLVFGLVASCLFITLHREYSVFSGRMVLAFPAMLAAFSAAYSLGAVIGISAVVRWAVVIPLVGSVLVEDLFGGGSSQAFGVGIDHGMDEGISLHPAFVLAFGAGIIGAVWFYMGRLRLARPVRVAIEQTGSGIGWRVDSGLGQFLLRQIRGRSHLDRWKYVWGTLFMSSFVDVRMRWFAFLSSVLVAALVSYVGSLGFLLYVIVCLLPAMGFESMPLCCDVFPSGGRRERYFAVMGTVAISWVSAIILGAGMILGTDLLTCVGPDFGVEGAWAAGPADPRLLWIPLLFIPLMGLCQVLQVENRVATSILAGVGILAILAVICMMVAFPLFAPRVIDVLRTWQVLVSSALAWLLLALVARRVALRGDLVERRRQKRVCEVVSCLF